MPINPLAVTSAEKLETRKEGKMILTEKELFELTGYIQGSRQAKWIHENYGFNPPIRADGHPSVTWNQINAPQIKPHNEPNWGVSA